MRAPLAELETRALEVWANRTLWTKAILRLRREYHRGGRMAEGAYRLLLTVIIDQGPKPTLFSDGSEQERST